MRYYLFLLFPLFSCAMLKDNNIDNHIDIQVLNKIIKLPLSDQIVCTDTIFIQLKNSSDYEYLFNISDTMAFYFYADVEEDKFIDPFGGFGCGFLDENGNYLEIYGNSVFNPEGFENEEDFIENEFARSLAPKSTVIFKIPLTFPSEIVYKSFIQSVPNIHQSKYIEIFIRPTNNHLNYSLKKGAFKLKKNQRVLNLYKSFKIPVETRCL